MISPVKAAAFDLDGTLWLGNQVIEGAIDTVTSLKNKSIKVFYFSNNSTKSRQEIFEKLLALGFNPDINEVYNSAYSTAKYAQKKGLNKVYCVGSPGLIQELHNNSIAITDNENETESVILGLDTTINYDKLAAILNIALRNKPVIACNRDKNYPVENNRLMPGLGAIVAAVEAMIERSIDAFVGKPETFMIKLLADDWNLANNEILVVGDSYSSDIEMAKRFNCQSILISEEKNKYNDTIVVRKITEILNMF